MMALAERSALACDIPRPSAPEPPSPATPSAITQRPFLPTISSPPPSRSASPPPSTMPNEAEDTPALTPSTSTPASTAPGTPATSPPPSTGACSPATSHTSLATPAGSGSDKEAEPSAGKDSDICSTSTGTLSVKFAPLPELAPRRRRSTAPLGMAARSSLMRARRGPATAAAEAGMALAVAKTEAETEMISLTELRWRQEEAAARYAQFQGSAYAEMARATEVEIAIEEAAREAKAMQRANAKGKGAKVAKLNIRSDLDVEAERIKMKAKRREYERDAAEDPILALGKVVKGVRRHLWKRGMSSTAPHSESPTALPAPEDACCKSVPDAPLRPILATIANTNSRPGRSSDTQNCKDSSSVKEVPSVTDVENNSTGNQAVSEDVEVKVNTDEPNQDSQTSLSTPTSTPLTDGLWAAPLTDDIPSDITQTETIVAGRDMRPNVVDAEGP